METRGGYIGIIGIGGFPEQSQRFQPINTGEISGKGSASRPMQQIRRKLPSGTGPDENPGMQFVPNKSPETPNTQNVGDQENTTPLEKDNTPLQRDFRVLSEQEKINIYLKLKGRFGTLSGYKESVVRLDQEQEISSSLHQGISVAIRGTRRIGKTSMLMSLHDQHNGIFIHGGNYGMKAKDLPQDKFLLIFGRSEVADYLCKNSEEKKQKIENSIAESGKPPFEFLHESLYANTGFILVAIDELISLQREEYLRHVADLTQFGNIHLVIDLPRIADDERRFGQIFSGFKEFYMRSLSYKEIEAHIQHVTERTGISFTPEAIDTIMKFSGGRPMEINTLCLTLFDRDYDSAGIKEMYHEADVQSITSHALTKYASEFEILIDNYEEEYYRALNDQERMVVQLILRKGRVHEAEIDSDLANSLLLLNFIKRDDNTNDFSINGGLFEKVLREKILNERRR